MSENSVKLVATISEAQYASFKIQYKGKAYLFELKGLLRGLAPFEPNYEKLIGEQIDKLEELNHQSILFSLPATFEKIIDANEETVSVTFFMKGLLTLAEGTLKLNFRHNMRLDSSKNDLNNDLGLIVNCRIARLEK